MAARRSRSARRSLHRHELGIRTFRQGSGRAGYRTRGQVDPDAGDRRSRLARSVAGSAPCAPAADDLPIVALPAGADPSDTFAACRGLGSGHLRRARYFDYNQSTPIARTVLREAGRPRRWAKKVRSAWPDGRVRSSAHSGSGAGRPRSPDYRRASARAAIGPDQGPTPPPAPDRLVGFALRPDRRRRFGSRGGRCAYGPSASTSPGGRRRSATSSVAAAAIIALGQSPRRDSASGRPRAFMAVRQARMSG